MTRGRLEQGRFDVEYCGRSSMTGQERGHAPSLSPSPCHGVSRRAALLRSAQALTGLGLACRAPSLFSAEPPRTDNSGEIWDDHVHLSGVAGSVEQRIDGLLQAADRLGIARLIVFMGTSFVEDPAPEEMRRQNDEVLRAIAHAPNRVLGMVYVNPKQREASLAELDRCVRDGPMVGVKLWIAMRCHQPDLDPIVRRAVELRVPITQHAYDRVGDNLPGESHAADVAALAARHPEANFICFHTGNDWERGVRAIRASKNVWAEFSGSDPTAGMVEMAVRELGAERVIYGSDAGGRSFASQLAKVYSAELPEDAQRLVLGGNIRRLLRPVMERKGMRL